MISDGTLRDMIASVLAGVSGIGRVNRYERFYQNEQQFNAFHTDESRKLNSATVTMSGLAGLDPSRGRDNHQVATSSETSYDIKLMKAQDDTGASQIALGELAQRVFLAFEAEAAHNVFRAQSISYGPVESTQIGIAAYGGELFRVLVNQAIIVIKLREELG